MTISAVLRRNARNPHVAGILVGACAFAFTLAWLVVGAVSGGFGGTPDQQIGFWAFFLLVTPPNAYLVARLCWRRWIAHKTSLRHRRAVAVGSVIGLLSFVTLSVLFVLSVIIAHLTLDGGSSVGTVAGLLYVMLLGPFFGLYLTAGIPVLLSIGIALLLAHLDWGGADDRHRRPGGRNPQEHVRPPR